MLMQFVAARRIARAACAAALLVAMTGGCGVKGPLVPAPKATATSTAPPSATAMPPSTTPVAPGASSAPPADPTDVPRRP